MSLEAKLHVESRLPYLGKASERVSLWRAKWVWVAFFVALAIRLLVVATANYDFKACCLEQRYVDSVATLASGKGLLMAGAEAHRPSSVLQMRALEGIGQRVNESNPYPVDERGWIAGTLHPPGYALLLWSFYEIGNYTGMLELARYTPAVLDALSVLLIFLFARNVYGLAVGIYSAWVYALMPGTIVLTLPFLPDAYARFFAALILAIASYSRFEKPWSYPCTGIAIGMAFYFRAEFLIWPLIIWMCYAFDTRSLIRPTLRLVPLIAAMLVVMLPWTLWTYQTVGRPMLSTSSSGGSMYQSLGQIPSNPWNIVLDDNWLGGDAVKRGFSSQWSPEASEFYARKWRENIAADPVFFLKTVMKERLPFALIPGYTYKHGRSNEEVNLSDLQAAERLTKWQFVERYPLLVLRNRGFEIAMMGLSAVLLVIMLISVVVMKSSWHKMAWLIIPWIATISSISIVKQIESRNVSTILVVQSVAVAIVIVALLRRHAGTSLFRARS